MTNTSNDEDGASVRIPPPLVGVLTILLGYALGRFFTVFPEFGFPAPERYWIGGTIAVLAGLVFGVWPITRFRKIDQDPTPWSPTPEIVIDGPYRITRNPMYLMMLLVCIGFAIILAEVWILILTPVCGVTIYLTAIRHEEAYLKTKFGDAYLDYMKKVRRWI